MILSILTQVLDSFLEKNRLFTTYKVIFELQNFSLPVPLLYPRPRPPHPHPGSILAAALRQAETGGAVLAATRKPQQGQ